MNNHYDKKVYVNWSLYRANFDNLSEHLPDSMGNGAIPVENLHINSADDLTISNSYGLAVGESIASGVSVSELPIGFYKLRFEMNNGLIYWDNIWVYRP